MGCSLRVVFHVSDHWHCFWPCYSTPMKAGRTRKGTEEDLKMNSFLPKQQGYHSPLSQTPWIFLSDFHIVSASQEERKLQNSECLLEYFLLNKEQEKKKEKKKKYCRFNFTSWLCSDKGEVTELSNHFLSQARD